MSMETVLMVILLFMAVMIGGCVEEQKAQPVWGKGELPAEHQGFFGNDNTARLDYVQNRVLDKHAAILKIIAIRVLALEAVDPNAIMVETRLDLLEASLIREAQGFRGAAPIEGMLRWITKAVDPKGKGYLEYHDGSNWTPVQEGR